MKFMIFPASLLAAAAGSAAAQDTPLQTQERAQIHYQAQLDAEGIPALLQAMQQYRFTNSEMLRVQNMIQEAQEKGVPADPMIAKVYEGMAKKVSEQNIVQAVERVRNRYENAFHRAEALTDDQGQIRTLGTVIAEAQTAGLRNEDCDRIVDQLQDRTRTMDKDQAYELSESSLLAVRNMTRYGVTSEAASDVMADALQQKFQAREMRQLQETFTTQARLGQADEVARRFSNEIRGGTDAAGLGRSGGGSGAARSGGVSGGSGSGGSGGESGGSGGGSDGSGGSGGSGSSGGSGGSSGGSGGSSGGSGGSG
ncbi:MAG: hypothetical protein SCH71_05915, partial [Desulfobulbaceae bacterium]|nr:hypothetical protein [Desulfobulbaceae bacterium]